MFVRSVILSLTASLAFAAGAKAQIITWGFTSIGSAPNQLILSPNGGAQTSSPTTPITTGGGVTSLPNTVYGLKTDGWGSNGYLEFTVAPSGHALLLNNLTLNYNLSTTGASTRTLSLYSGVDSFTTALGSIILFATGTDQSNVSINFNLATSTPTTFRLKSSDLASTDFFQIQNFNHNNVDTSTNGNYALALNGSVAIPEPSSMILTGLCSVLGGGMFFRRGRQPLSIATASPDIQA